MNAHLIMAPLPTDTLAGSPTPVTNLAAVQDRRRPGRPDQVSSALIPLLRDPTPSDDTSPLFDDTLSDDDDELAPMRGIAVATLLSVPLWFLIGLGGWLIF
jgi:hypothetical protein